VADGCRAALRPPATGEDPSNLLYSGSGGLIVKLLLFRQFKSLYLAVSVKKQIHAVSIFTQTDRICANKLCICQLGSVNA